MEDAMKKTILLFVIVLCMLPLAAATEYVLDGGYRITLNDDGTYDVMEEAGDTSVLVGRCYTIDKEEMAVKTLLTEFYDYDYELMSIDSAKVVKAAKDSAMLELLIADIPDFTILFPSSEHLIIVMGGEEPMESSYTMTPAGVINISALSSDVATYFNKDFSELSFVSQDDETVMTLKLQDPE